MEPLRPHPSRAVDPSSPGVPSRPLRILVVEDSPSEATRIEQELKRWGIQAHFVLADGSEGFSRALQGPPVDLVIADDDLPELDGFRVLELVRERYPEVPVLVVTGARDEGMAVASVLAGAADYVLKDHLARLPVAVLHALERTRSRVSSLQAREALRESEERYRLLVEHLPVVVFTFRLEPTPRLTYVSPRIREFLGIPPEQWLTDPSLLWRRLFPEDRRAALRWMHSTRAGGPAEEFTFRALGEGEEVRWLRAWAVASSDPEGRLHLLGTLQDITDLKDAELERDLLFATVEQSKTVIMVTDTQGRILYANPALEAVTGYPRPQVLGSDPLRLFGGEEDPDEDLAFWDALRRGDTTLKEFRWRRRDGSWFVVKTSISPLRLSGGRTTHLMWVAQDITGEKQLEAQILRMQKMETLGQFAGGLAHDMNNLLTTILGYTALARAELKPDQASVDRDLLEVEQAAHRGAELLKTLLTIAKKEKLSLAPVEVGGAVRKLWAILSRLIPETIRISVKTPPTGAWCLADETALAQILTNLAVNARDAMPGGGTLSFQVDPVEVAAIPPGATHRPAPGSFVRIRVQDTGPGIPPEVRERMFEPFYSTKPPGQGTGLGLAIVFGLVGQQGGFLTVESAPGAGTVMDVHLPAVPGPAVGDAPPPPPEAPPQAEPGAEPTAGSGAPPGDILLVEDELGPRSVARAILEQAGYRVLVAEGGEEAWEALRRGEVRPQLVLADYHLPDMTGLELLRRIRADLEQPPRFLLVSGHLPEELARLASEGVPCLCKPWTVQSLLGAVREALAPGGALAAFPAEPASRGTVRPRSSGGGRGRGPTPP